MPKTAYELEREANIARNRALLEQLQVKEAVSALGIPAKPSPEPKAKPIQPSKKAKAKSEKEVVEAPRRQSSRLKRAAVDPNESPAKKRKREQDEEKLRRKQEEERLAEEERAREAKRPRHHELSLATLGEREEWDGSTLSGIRTLFRSIAEKALPRTLSRHDAYIFDVEEEEELELAALRKRLQKLKVVSRAKVTQDRVYSAAYHPEPTKDLVFFGDKHGQLGVWDAQAAREYDEDDSTPASDREGGVYWRLQPHWPATSKSSISCIKFDPFNAHSVYTSAYDCTVRIISFESGLSREVFSMDDTLINSIDIPPASHEMWISDAAGGLTHLDLREDKSKARWYQLSDQKIGSVSVNPLQPTFLLTASNSRILKVWDARRLESIPVLENSLDFNLDRVNEYCQSKAGKACQRGEFEHGKSVSSAYWDPRGRTIVSTSYDDAIRLWDIGPASLAKDTPFPKFKPFSRMKHNCQTGKWVTILRAQWSTNPDVYPHFTIGNMDHSLNVFSCKGDLLAKLQDKSRITAVQAVTCSHPTIVGRIASGNASGRCVLWAPGDENE
ncbi:WD40 repeat-like protein [Vararia minispora EC-137]|uniref:WD40 repeat-like protein n=1 Tax=Vararia minispora EC-137 TaxID=1314806 RepID=A0ACB8QUI9_9AGAM|nr:WD40 repeat-like protein [Vararia minispora EC-137]